MEIKGVLPIYFATGDKLYKEELLNMICNEIKESGYFISTVPKLRSLGKSQQVGYKNLNYLLKYEFLEKHERGIYTSGNCYNSIMSIKEVKELYYKENTTIDMVDYEDKFFFSLNTGDYTKPIV